jgi:insertion element IS1 protein InsB
MICISVRCPYCHSEQIVKRGTTRRGTQRYLCQTPACPSQRFRLEYRYQGRLPEVKQQIIAMSLNASGMRDTTRVLPISTDTVLRALRKKAAALASVHTALLRTVKPAGVIVDMQQAGEAEGDELWSCVGKQGNQLWLWHAIEHHTGKVLASVFGRREAEVLLQLKALLEALGLTRFSTDHWGAYAWHLEADVPSPGKRPTQQIERKPLTLRTRSKRLVRKTICFSKSIQMHTIVIGLFVNRYAFGVLV